MSDKSPIKIGYCLSLSGGLASNGKTARLAHQIWQENVNENGGLLGRPVELVCLDDQTNPNLVADLYQRLLDVEKVDLVIGGYGDNSVAPAMTLIMERKKFFLGLMALAVNAKLHYPRYFTMIPTGPHPHVALTEGFFEIAGQQNPKPETVSFLIADAPFSQSPAQGARENLARHGMHVVSEDKYPLSTTNFRPYMESLKKIDPDILFFCSYINDSIALVKTMNAVGLSPRFVGGAMIGPQNGIVKAELGPLLNGLVNYDYWLPVPSLLNEQIESLIAAYQSRAEEAGADPLGYYVAPLAYSQLQVLEQAVKAVGSLDDGALTDYARTATFETVVGKVEFGEDGAWDEPRVLTVQFQNIEGNNISEFKKPDTQAVVYPSTSASAKVIYPYREAKRYGPFLTFDRRFMNQPKKAEEQKNGAVIRELYSLAEATSKDTPKFVSLFAEGGYFYDVAAGKKYYGDDIGYTVDVYASAFPDMHRELYEMYFYDDVVVVELSLNGTHRGDLTIPEGTIPPTNKEMHAPCCDVFHLKDGKVVSFHCYVAVPILLKQLGVFGNLSAAIKK